MTHKRLVAVVISFWVFSVIACFWYESISVLSVMSVVCIITTGLLCCKIYAAVRHHTNQIRALQVPEQVAQNGDMANAARLRKTAVATFYMYILFLIFHTYSFFKKYINSCTAKLRRQRRRTVKTTIDLISKKATLHVQHTFFVHFFAVVLHDYNVKLPQTS